VKKNLQSEAFGRHSTTYFGARVQGEASDYEEAVNHGEKTNRVSGNEGTADFRFARERKAQKRSQRARRSRSDRERYRKGCKTGNEQHFEQSE